MDIKQCWVLWCFLKSVNSFGFVFHESINLHAHNPFKDFWHMRQNTDRSIIFLSKSSFLFENKVHLSKLQLIWEIINFKRKIYDFSYKKKMYINRRFQNICRNVSYRSGFRAVYQIFRYNFSLVLTVHLLLSILGWELKASITSSKLFILFSLSSFSSKPLVVLIKKLFVIVANCFSFETRFPFSLRRSLFQFSPLLIKYSLIVSQNFLLSDKSRMFKFWKFFFFFLGFTQHSRFKQKFLCFL